MKITIDTAAYNHRRYGKPWIARVDFSVDPKGVFAWGDWVGDHLKGDAGLLIIDVANGDIVAEGQKDFRGRGTECNYYQVQDGELVKLSGKAEAYRAHIASHTNVEK